MTLTGSRRRVAAALSAALLAGAGTAWITRPAASAETADGHPSRVSTTVSTLAPDDSVMPTPPAGSSGAPAPTTRRGSSPPSGVPLLGRPVSTPTGLGTGPVPNRLLRERLGITMTVKAEGVASDGEMALAPDPADIGWYRYGARPGDAAGATVLAAHVDAPGYGIGPLARLTQLRRGDVLTVTSGRRSGATPSRP